MTLQRSIGRDEGKDGLSFPLKTQFTPRGAGLPKVNVSLAPDTSDTPVKVEREGQSLVAILLPDGDPLSRVYALDGDGLLVEESTGPTARAGQIADDGHLATGRYDTSTVTLVEDAMVLELVSVGLDDSPPVEGLGSSCVLHDGHGSWARLAGLPLLPLSLSWVAPDANHAEARTGKVAATWALLDPDLAGDGLPDVAFDHLVIAFDHHLPHGIALATTQIREISGKLDWRFSEPEFLDQAYLVRIEATVDLQPRGQLSGMSVLLRNVVLWARHPVGTLRLPLDPSVTVLVNDRKLTVSLPRHSAAPLRHSPPPFASTPGRLSSISTTRHRFRSWDFGSPGDFPPPGSRACRSCSASKARR